jgi:hypothetical protein
MTTNMTTNMTSNTTTKMEGSGAAGHDGKQIAQQMVQFF